MLQSSRQGTLIALAYRGPRQGYTHVYTLHVYTMYIHMEGHKVKREREREIWNSDRLNQ